MSVDVIRTSWTKTTKELSEYCGLLLANFSKTGDIGQIWAEVEDKAEPRQKSTTRLSRDSEI